MKKKRRYIKTHLIKEFENQYFNYEKLKSPNFPNYARVKTSFRDDTANGLTNCICKWLTMCGHFAARVNTTGTYSMKLKRYIHSGSRNGMADITAVVNCRHVSIEVKIGKDKLRREQMKVKDEVENAGGFYIVVSSFDNFIEQILDRFGQIWTISHGNNQ